MASTSTGTTTTTAGRRLRVANHLCVRRRRRRRLCLRPSCPRLKLVVRASSEDEEWEEGEEWAAGRRGRNDGTSSASGRGRGRMDDDPHSSFSQSIGSSMAQAVSSHSIGSSMAQTSSSQATSSCSSFLLWSLSFLNLVKGVFCATAVPISAK